MLFSWLIAMADVKISIYVIVKPIGCGCIFDIYLNCALFRF